MDEEQRKELYNLFRLLFAAQVDSDKYSQVESYEELNTLLEQNPTDKSAVEQTMNKYTEEELLQIAANLQGEDVESAKKGKKLEYAKKLRSYKKGQKCKCGCDLVLTKESGGKLTQKCACGCKL
ncbi:MAG: hypothetical protein PF569_08710 [Candidatus Woesearchaeota archaeon]|jgi:hypothetical protein|nr:hypothetical protein [Candidatus Woesearchaeota archaeon]